MSRERLVGARSHYDVATPYTRAVKPLEILDETRTPDGTLVTLARQDRELIILAGGKPLMSSRMHGSEAALAQSRTWQVVP